MQVTLQYKGCHIHWELQVGDRFYSDGYELTREGTTSKDGYKLGITHKCHKQIEQFLIDDRKAYGDYNLAKNNCQHSCGRLVRFLAIEKTGDDCYDVGTFGFFEIAGTAGQLGVAGGSGYVAATTTAAWVGTAEGSLAYGAGAIAGGAAGGAAIGGLLWYNLPMPARNANLEPDENDNTCKRANARYVVITKEWWGCCKYYFYESEAHARKDFDSWWISRILFAAPRGCIEKPSGNEYPTEIEARGPAPAGNTIRYAAMGLVEQ